MKIETKVSKISGKKYLQIGSVQLHSPFETPMRALLFIVGTIFIFWSL